MVERRGPRAELSENEFSGHNCKYKCERCFNRGRCTNEPSDTDGALCTCPNDEGKPSLYWALNCCPIGFRVSDIKALEKYPQIRDGIMIPNPLNNPEQALDSC